MLFFFIDIQRYIILIIEKHIRTVAEVTIPERQPLQSLLCPNCRKLISRSEDFCPFCGMKNPGSGANRLMASMALNDPRLFIKAVITLNIAMYVLSLLFNSGMPGMGMNPLTLLSPGSRSLMILGGTGKLPIDSYHRWWSLISANYLHGGLLHILFNMMAFRQICPLVIREYGLHRTIGIYSLSGVIGFYVSYLAGVNFTIGASAAIFGLMGALIYYGKSRGGVYGQAIFKQVGGWVLGMFLLGIMVPMINNWGHGGGLAGGILTAYLLGYQEKTREKPGHRTMAFALCLITLLTLAWAVLSGFYIRLFS
jgi:rhomboid protease GluP